MFDNLFYGAIFFFIIVPLIFCFIFLFPGLVKEDFREGIALIKDLDILHGIAVFTRPIWSTALIIFFMVCFAVVSLWEEL